QECIDEAAHVWIPGRGGSALRVDCGHPASRFLADRGVFAGDVDGGAGWCDNDPRHRAVAIGIPAGRGAGVKVEGGEACPTEAARLHEVTARVDLATPWIERERGHLPADPRMPGADGTVHGADRAEVRAALLPNAAEGATDVDRLAVPRGRQGGDERLLVLLGRGDPRCPAQQRTGLDIHGGEPEPLLSPELREITAHVEGRPDTNQSRHGSLQARFPVLVEPAAREQVENSAAHGVADVEEIAGEVPTTAAVRRRCDDRAVD